MIIPLNFNYFLISLMRIFLYINSIMKSFQDWLDCQLYTSHLKNLTKIKQETLYMKSSSPNRQNLKTASIRRNISQIPTPQYKNQAKAKHQHIKQQMKENKILQQNYSLANRLLNVSPVISKDKQIKSYRKYQSLFKKNRNNNNKFDTLRTKKLQQFFKAHQHNFLVGLHKVVLIISFLHIPRIPEGHSPTLWMQIYSGNQKLTSAHYSVHQILQNQVKFPLKKRPQKNLVLLLHCSRGLTYINLGQYYIQAPRKGMRKEHRNLVSHQDSRKNISLDIKIQEINQRHKSLQLR